jgi:hypothetical protein
VITSYSCGSNSFLSEKSQSSSSNKSKYLEILDSKLFNFQISFSLNIKLFILSLLFLFSSDSSGLIVDNNFSFFDLVVGCHSFLVSVLSIILNIG